jgi:hypothetical protein
VEDVKYYGKGVNAGLLLYDCTGTMTFRRFDIGVPPGSNGLLSCSGGGQMIDIRGRLVFDHCNYERFDDDGADILTNYVRVLSQPDARTIVLERGSHYVVGDRLSIVDWATMQEVSEPKVVGVTPLDGGESKLTLDSDIRRLHVGAGDSKSRDSQVNDGIDRVADYNNACQSVLFTHCRFQCNRARPLNLKCQNCIVEDCQFYDCVMSPIEAGPEMWWGEAPYVHNLTIRHNTFSGNKSPDIDIGVFYDKEQDCLGMDNTGILIEDNRFNQFGSHGAIRLRNSRDVIIRGNQFGESAAPLGTGYHKVNVLHCGGVAIEANKGLK